MSVAYTEIGNIWFTGSIDPSGNMLINARPDTVESNPENAGIALIDNIGIVTHALLGLCGSCEYNGKGCGAASKKQIWGISNKIYGGVKHILTEIPIDEGFNPKNSLPCK